MSYDEHKEARLELADARAEIARWKAAEQEIVEAHARLVAQFERADGIGKVTARSAVLASEAALRALASVHAS